jgi:hypothetical protein
VGLLSVASGEEGYKRNKRNTAASLERTVSGVGREETKTPKRREEDFVGSAADFVYVVRGKSGQERQDRNAAGGKGRES